MPDLHTIEPRRICLIKPSAFGDVVQTLPLLPVLKERFPQAAVSWVVRAELRELLEGHPQLDEIVPFQRRGTWRESWRLLRDLRRRQFDLVFDLQGLLRTAAMTFATAAPLRVGLETAREGAQWACHQTLPDSGRLVPAHLRYWRVAEALGMGDRRRETIVHTSPDDRRWAAEQLAKLNDQAPMTNAQFSRQSSNAGIGDPDAGSVRVTTCEPQSSNAAFGHRELGIGTSASRPVLAVHPGARWATKRWPVERFAIVAARAARRFGFGTVVLGSRDETITAGRFEFLFRRFAPSARCVNLAGKTTIKQLAALLQRADVLLSSDSGPMHLAAGLGRPVVGVFTCTDPVRSGPPADTNHEAVTTSLPCRNCYKKQCPNRRERRLACLNDVSTDAVWNAFERLVERHAKPQQAA
jgi:ADP-heptose:LPS heptosyltransferase